MDRRQRFEPFDLTVSGWRGDIKTSTYFLHVRRSFPLSNDFYIVALYDEATRQRLNIVMMKPALWEKINGETKSCQLRNVARHFPNPVQVNVRGENLIVVSYSMWKQLILRMKSPTTSSYGSRYCQIKNETVPGNPESMGVSRGGQEGTDLYHFSFVFAPSWNH